MLEGIDIFGLEMDSLEERLNEKLKMAIIN